METKKRFDLVDREAVKDAIGFMNLHFLGHGETKSVLDSINEVPAVDAVEVVRCKDCKHWHEETGWCYHHSHFVDSKGGFCHPWESNDWKMLNADDFCFCGERKCNDKN